MRGLTGIWSTGCAQLGRWPSPTTEQVSEPSRDVIAWVRFNHPPSGRGLEPKRVEHLQFGSTCIVTEILDCREHPRSPEQMLGKPDLIRWWLLKVSGPMPGHPADRREFVMQASACGDPRGWWITVEPRKCPGRLICAPLLPLHRAARVRRPARKYLTVISREPVDPQHLAVRRPPAG